MSFAILINSFHTNTIALERLLSSLRSDTMWTSTKCYVVVGGCQEKSSTIQDDIVIVNVDHNSYDYTGFVTIVEKIIPFHDHFFYMHDTVVVGEKFLSKIYDYLDVVVKNGYDGMKFPGPSMNIGFYRTHSLLDLTAFILSMKRSNTSSIQETKTLNVNEEDGIFRRLQLCAEFPHGKTAVRGPEDFYSTGVMRIVEYYGDIDMYKAKANWFWKQEWESRL